MPSGGAGRGQGRKIGSRTTRSQAVTQVIVEKAAAEGITPLEVMLKAMRLCTEGTKPDWFKAAGIAKDAAPYMHPRLNSVNVGGQPGFPIETKDVSLAELARRIAFIFGQAALETKADGGD